MQNDDRRFKQIISWLLPSGAEVFVYFFAGLATLALCNLGFIQNLLHVPENFQLGSAIIGSIESLLDEAVGEETAGRLALALFWALVGTVVYTLVWLSQNFSTELGNSLAISRFIHPEGSDRQGSLKLFLSVGLFRLSVAFILLFHTRLFLNVTLPYWTSIYRETIALWPNLQSILQAFIALVAQAAGLHVFTVLIRLLLLRKRVFGNQEVEG